MKRDVTAIMRPATVAVIGASGTRRTQGNQVIGNLQRAGFQGTILPVHASAETIEGLPVINGIAGLPPGIDTAVVAIPASGVATALTDLDRAGVRSAVIFSNGFTAAEADACRAVMGATGMVIHGLAVDGQLASPVAGVTVFHAGTTRPDPEGPFIVSGGRVLAVTGVGPSIAAARTLAYEGADRISFDGAQRRLDIAADAAQKEGS